jgi:hypothetical protein
LLLIAILLLIAYLLRKRPAHFLRNARPPPAAKIASPARRIGSELVRSIAINIVKLPWPADLRQRLQLRCHEDASAPKLPRRAFAAAPRAVAEARIYSSTSVIR